MHVVTEGQKAFFLICTSFLVVCATASDQFSSSYTPFSQSLNDFGFDLFQKLEAEGNLFVSPFSIYAAMAMVLDGAAGTSASQLQASLKLTARGLTNEDLKNSFKKLLDDYMKGDAEYTLEVANGVFPQKGFEINDQFINDMKDYYDANVETLDFYGNGNAAKDELNQFVADKTHDKIKELFSAQLDPLTKLVLINAIYFKGIWVTQFNKNDTYNGTFCKNGNGEVQVMFMQLRDQEFPAYFDSERGYKFLELPYKGKDIVFLVALPDNSEQFPDLQLDSETLYQIVNSLTKRKLDRTVIPKFKLDYMTELQAVLTKLGIKDIFDPNAADLSGISCESKLAVSAVFHKAVIEVNEEGSEAAAATGVIAQPTAGSTIDNSFVADHPFLFFIFDKKNGIVLFSGRVADPS